MSNEYYRVHNHVMRNTESLHELRETNNSLLTTKQNETMRVLTGMALLTFPLTLFVTISDFHGSEENHLLAQVGRKGDGAPLQHPRDEPRARYHVIPHHHI
jgi:hypothetical protein